MILVLVIVSVSCLTIVLMHAPFFSRCVFGAHGGVLVVVEEHDGLSGFFLQSAWGVCPPPPPSGAQFGSLLLLSQFNVVGPLLPLTQSLALGLHFDSSSS